MAKKRRPKKPKVGVKPKRERRNVESIDFVYKESGRKSPTDATKIRTWDARAKGINIFVDYEGRIRTAKQSNIERYGPDGDAPST